MDRFQLPAGLLWGLHPLPPQHNGRRLLALRIFRKQSILVTLAQLVESSSAPSWHYGCQGEKYLSATEHCTSWDPPGTSRWVTSRCDAVSFCWLACSLSLASSCCWTTAHPLCLRDLKQDLEGIPHPLTLGSFLLWAGITKSGPQHRGNLNTIWKENMEIFPLMCSTGILLSTHSFSSLQAAPALGRVAGCWWALVLGHMRWQHPLETFCSLPLR